MVDILRGLLGLFILVFLAFLLSNNKRKIAWRLVIVGCGLQFIFALLVLKVPVARKVFDFISSFFVAILDFAREGSTFLFGNLISSDSGLGFIFVFEVLPSIVFFSALISALYHLNILQKVVYVFAWIMKKTMRLSGAETLAASANIFLGQTEAPLLVKPYVEKMTKSEILALMVGGMANIAGGVLVTFVGFLGGTDPELKQAFATHLLTASIMSAPASLVIAKIMIPETENNNMEMKLSGNSQGSNLLDAIATGTSDGIKLAINVGAMLLVFIAFIAMANSILNYIGAISINKATLNDTIKNLTHGNFSQLSLQFILGYIFAPFAWILGVPFNDITLVGQLLGEKTVLNELVAYKSLSTLKNEGLLTNEKSIIIATYALCGFANFSSIGIQIGGIGAMAPGKRKQLSELGFKALIGGTLATFMTAAIAGMLI
jgi:CNT family concentrative nucleoside transporter